MNRFVGGRGGRYFGGRSGGGDFQPCNIQTTPVQRATNLCPEFVGAFSSRGKDSETLRGDEGLKPENEVSGKFANTRKLPGGTEGTPAEVVVDMYPVEMTKVQSRCLYRVDFSPDVEFRVCAVKLLSAVLRRCLGKKEFHFWVGIRKYSSAINY